jgi:rhodanese-related sulfurtransferase
MLHTNKFLEIVNSAKAQIRETNPIAVYGMQQNGKDNFFLVDVREESEWLLGHLPKAIHLCKGVIERDIEKTISDLKSSIILYCGGGYRSALAADNLQKMGYINVLSMDGGYSEWTRKGFPVISD